MGKRFKSKLLIYVFTHEKTQKLTEPARGYKGKDFLFNFRITIDYKGKSLNYKSVTLLWKFLI